MTTTNYPKDINETNFLNGTVDPGRLSEDIEDYLDEDDLTITVALDAIEITENEGADDICNIWFKSELSTDEQTMLDDVCAAHTGEPLPSEVTSVTLEPTGSSLKDLQAVIVDFEAELNDTTEKLIGFNETRYIQGLSVELRGHTYGLNKDKISVSIVAPDGQGGWVVARSLVSSSTEEKVAVPPSGVTHVVAEGTATMPVELRIRVRYTSVATTGDKPYVHLILRTWM